MKTWKVNFLVIPFILFPDQTEEKENEEDKESPEDKDKSSEDIKPVADSKSTTKLIPLDVPLDPTKYYEVEEFFVKYRNFSYLHCEWRTEEELLKGDKRIGSKIKRFKIKLAHHTNIFENVSDTLFFTMRSIYNFEIILN